MRVCNKFIRWYSEVWLERGGAKISPLQDECMERIILRSNLLPEEVGWWLKASWPYSWEGREWTEELAENRIQLSTFRRNRKTDVQRRKQSSRECDIANQLSGDISRKNWLSMQFSQDAVFGILEKLRRKEERTERGRIFAKKSKGIVRIETSLSADWQCIFIEYLFSNESQSNIL